MFYGHEVEHDREYTLLHFTGILSAENDHLMCIKIDGDAGARCHADRVPVCGEGAGIVDSKVWAAIGLHLLLGGTDKHVSHEETVVRSSTDDTDFDSVTRVPACVSIKDVNSGTGIEIVNCTFSVDSPDLFSHGLVDRTPPDMVPGGRLIDDPLVWCLSARAAERKQKTCIP